MDKRYLVRWLDEGTVDCLRDDGVSNHSGFELILLPYVEIAESIEDAQHSIVDDLINDELIDAWDEHDPTIFVVPPTTEFTWEEGDVKEYWECKWRGETVASAIITEIKMEKQD